MKTRMCSCPKCHAALQLLEPVPPRIVCLHCGAHLCTRKRRQWRCLRTQPRRIRIVPPPLPPLTLPRPASPPPRRRTKRTAALVAIALLSLLGSGGVLIFDLTRSRAGGAGDAHAQAPAQPPTAPLPGPPPRPAERPRGDTLPVAHAGTRAAPVRDTRPSPARPREGPQPPVPESPPEPPAPPPPPPPQLVAVAAIPGLSVPAPKQRRIERAIAAGVGYLKRCLADIDRGKYRSEDLSNLVPRQADRDFKKLLGDRGAFRWRFVRLGTGGRGSGARTPPANLVFGMRGADRETITDRFLLESYFALMGWALLESGVPASDPAVQGLAIRVREEVATTADHFAVAVTLLFLDRLGDPRDRALCRSCALRLVAAQSVRNDWTAIPLCCRLGGEDERLLLALLAAAGAGRTKEVERLELTPYLKLLPVCQALGARTVRLPVTDPDESGPLSCDSHFAQLALRAARRRGLPVQPSLALLARYYRRQQGPSGAFAEPRPSSTPGYGWTFGSTTWFTTPSFDRCWTWSTTCAALTGLGIAEGDGRTLSRGGRLDTADPVIGKGFRYLLASKVPPGGAAWHRGLYYSLWSEKVLAATYGLPRLGDRDWYAEAADTLLTKQRPDGSWDDDFLPPPLATCFALMTLMPDRPPS